MKFICNLLLLFLLLFYTSSVDAANAINCRQQETVLRVKRQTAELTPQQQYHQQRQRNLHEQRSSQTSAVIKPVVRFFAATPGQQVQQLQVNSGPEQRIAFTSQQQQQQHHAAIKAVLVKQQQQQHYRQSYGSQQQQQSSLLSSSSLTQSANSQQYLQSNSYMQRLQQQQQQAYNINNFPRISQQLQQQQQQFQTQPLQQFHQSQRQPFKFYKPQITTITNRIFQDNISNRLPTSYPPQPPSQPQLESTFSPNQDKGAVAPVLSPLLPSYLDEDDKLNYTRQCDMCCIPGQSPCQHCCDTNPLLSATVLKSSVG